MNYIRHIGVLVLALMSTAVWAQTISGTVTDENNQPLPGATVVVQGTNTGTTTDFDGKYQISASQGQTLVVSYVGYATQNVMVNSTTHNVSLQADNELDEVVVVAQGIQAKPRSLSYSMQGVSSDDIGKAQETNVVSALSSKAAGVQVITSSGSVGASANIRVRGSTSVQRSNAPLFVVDGVPIDNSSYAEDPTTTSNNASLGGTDFSNRAVDINASDIKSVSVLKGLAAQTLYGLRAANGVVLINTKKGSAGKTKFTFSQSTSFSNYNKLPELQRTYAQGGVVGGKLTWRGPHTYEGDSWGPKVSDLEYDGSNYDFHPDGKLVAKGTGNGKAAQTYDHYKFFKTGIRNDLNFSASGGVENTLYRVSFGKLSQKGIAPNETFDRQTYRLDLNSELVKNLSLSASGQFIKSGGNRVQRGSNISGIMLGLIRTSPTFDNGNGNTGQSGADIESSYYYTIDGQELPGQRSYRNGIYNNPYFTVSRNKNEDDVNRFLGRLGLSYQHNENLSVNSSLSIDRYTDKRLVGFDLIDASFGNGRIFNDNISNQDVNWNLILNGNYELDDAVNLSFNVGYDGFKQHSNRTTLIGDGLAIPGFFNLSNVSSIQSNENTSERLLIGAFATATLELNEMFYLTPSFRNDWSSTLPEKNNTFQSYSIGGSFVFSELLGDSFLDYGKIRASYGKSGNDAAAYATVTNFAGTSVSGDGFIQSVAFPAYDQVSFERLSRAGNSNLKPEETTEFEIGLELATLNNNLKLDVAYYDKKTTDQILPVDTAPSSGYIDRFDNVGVVTNSGVELTLSANIINKSDWDWDVNMNWTTYENVVEELAKGVDFVTLNGFSGTKSVAYAGESYGAILGSKFQRNDKGELLIGDDGYPLQDSEQGIVGDPIPDWTAGISSTLRFKDLYLSVLFDIRQGGDVWCGTCGIIDYFGTSTRTLKRDQTTVFDGVVKSTGLKNTKVVPWFDATKSENNNYWRRYGFGGTAESNVYDSSWLRLREVTLRYNLPNSLLGNTFIDGISVSVYGRNLWLKTDYPGIDPETNLTGDSNGFGLDYFNQPNTKSFGLDLKLTF